MGNGHACLGLTAIASLLQWSLEQEANFVFWSIGLRHEPFRKLSEWQASSRPIRQSSRVEFKGWYEGVIPYRLKGCKHSHRIYFALVIKAKMLAGTPRVGIEKVWRTVRWAESFPDESLAMDTVDLTPTFAIRKIAMLFDRRKFAECAALVTRLNGITITAILTEIPVEMLHNALPASLPILEALYEKVYRNSESDFPTGQLMTDQLVKRLVTLFAWQHQAESSNDARQMSAAQMISCRTIIRIVLSVEPDFRSVVRQRKRAIDRCVRNMGRHGLVDSSGGKLMTLHDALKVELEKVVILYRCALQKLDSHHVTASLTSGPAPKEASHQRMMQVCRADVQDRIIKNKTLFNLVEPAVSGQYLRKLITILEKRIDYDKVLLFHDTELRKMSEGGTQTEASLATALRHFSHGYGTILSLISQVSGSDGGSGTHSTMEDLGSSGDEDLDDILPVSSSLSITEKMKAISLNGIIPMNSWGRSQLISVTASRAAAALARNGGTTGDMEGEVSRRNDFSHKPSVLDVHRNGFLTAESYCSLEGPANVQQTISGPLFPMGMDADAGPSSSPPQSNHQVMLLEQEVTSLKTELAQARETIRKLQAQEKELRTRLADHIHSRFTSHPTQALENLSLGTLRPTSLVRAYDDLYREGRVDSLDALDTLPELTGLDILKMKILFSVIVLAFRCVHHHLHELRMKLRQLLCLPVPSMRPSHSDGLGDPHVIPDMVSAQMEDHISKYLTHTVDRHDVEPLVNEVCQNIYATLYDYPGLQTCDGLVEYARTAVRLAWGLSVQVPPYTISYDAQKFLPQNHDRFHTSDSDSEDIKSFLWPMLVDGHTGLCVTRGVVIT
ncbi:hypothetical protein RRG08_006061 [Elysia crispata]|uniref:Mitochondria-eating protein n=1 Tax=Elysia crispata TaxID=231223 RepID=A0AAE1D9K8_9GAST|nr:hypothetical protein RRG08_006061 [Elysia crispata]